MDLSLWFIALLTIWFFIFCRFFDKNFPFAILYKMAKFHYHTAFPFEVIHSVKCSSRFILIGTWRRHENQDFKTLEFEYLKNQKRF